MEPVPIIGINWISAGTSGLTCDFAAPGRTASRQALLKLSHLVERRHLVSVVKQKPQHDQPARNSESPCDDIFHFLSPSFNEASATPLCR